jgi:hypothetical protein
MLAVAAAGVLSACGDSTSSSPGAPRLGTTPVPSRTSGGSSPGSDIPALPEVTAWHPDAGDLSPLAKLTAVRHIEASGNGRNRAVQVIDAQYGGLLADSASVLVVTRSWRGRVEETVTGGHTFDVRLVRTASGWQVTAVHPSHPGPFARTHSKAARGVLISNRILLPPAARYDVKSGRVHDSVLGAMLTLGRTYRIHVSVVRSGHPIYVFGTDRLSDHPQGRAFDTWAIDGRSVVDPATPRALVEDYMRAAAAAGSYNVGGPYLLGAAPQWFTDDTHHDHVHAGFLT